MFKRLLALGAVGGILATLVILTASGASNASVHTAKAGGTLRIAVASLNSSLDSQIACDQVTWSAVNLVNDQLIHIQPNMKTLQPWLAKSWRHPNAKTWIVNLRHGIKFQDGEPFDSRAAVFTFKRFQQPNTCLHGVYAPYLKKIRAMGRYRFEIITKRPSWSFIYLLVYPDMLPPKATAKSSFPTHPVGTGPYQVSSYTPNHQLVLVKNPRYWAKPIPYSKIVWTVIPDDSARVAALESGQVDMINNVPPVDIPRIKSHDDLQVVSAPTVRPMTLSVDMAKATPFTKLKVRQALQYAINRKALVSGILKNYGTVMERYLESPLLRYAVKLPRHAYNPTKAKQLLAAAGFPNGIKGCTMGGPSGRYVDDALIGQAVQEELRSVGINCSLREEDIGSLSVDTAKGKSSPFDIFLQSQSPASFGIQYGLQILYVGSPYTFWSPTKLQTLWYRADAAKSDKKRQALYKALQTKIWQQGPVIPLYFSPTLLAIRRGVPFTPRVDEWMWLSDRYRLK